ncbi:hypothetical protein F5879DRAFT_975786 [Lentinula edodes]|nr:hypothetical protein F5879DRAFT_975786 [Lentinula edodes]
MPLTKDEKAWAVEKLSSFVDHQNRKVVADFWPPLRAAFFSRFPLVTEISTDVDAETREALGRHSDEKFKALRNFLNNHSINNSSRKSRAQARDAVKIYIGGSHSTATKSKTSNRHHKKQEIYSRLYYNAECKTQVDLEITNLGESISRSERMKIRNKYINAGWEAAQQDPVKMEAIEVVLKSEKEEVPPAAMPTVASGQLRQLKGMEHVEFMRNLDMTISEVSLKLATLGGLCTMFIAAGLDPDNNNSLRTYGFHVGHDIHGQPFYRALPDYKTRVLRPFLNFAEHALAGTIDWLKESAQSAPETGPALVSPVSENAAIPSTSTQPPPVTPSSVAPANSSTVVSPCPASVESDSPGLPAVPAFSASPSAADAVLAVSGLSTSSPPPVVNAGAPTAALSQVNPSAGSSAVVSISAVTSSDVVNSALLPQPPPGPISLSNACTSSESIEAWATSPLPVSSATSTAFGFSTEPTESFLSTFPQSLLPQPEPIETFDPKCSILSNMTDLEFQELSDAALRNAEGFSNEDWAHLWDNNPETNCEHPANTGSPLPEVPTPKEHFDCSHLSAFPDEQCGDFPFLPTFPKQPSNFSSSDMVTNSISNLPQVPKSSAVVDPSENGSTTSQITSAAITSLNALPTSLPSTASTLVSLLDSTGTILSNPLLGSLPCTPSTLASVLDSNPVTGTISPDSRADSLPSTTSAPVSISDSMLATIDTTCVDRASPILQMVGSAEKGSPLPGTDNDLPPSSTKPVSDPQAASMTEPSREIPTSDYMSNPAILSEPISDPMTHCDPWNPVNDFSTGPSASNILLEVSTKGKGSSKRHGILKKRRTSKQGGTAMKPVMAKTVGILKADNTLKDKLASTVGTPKSDPPSKKITSVSTDNAPRSDPGWKQVLVLRAPGVGAVHKPTHEAENIPPHHSTISGPAPPAHSQSGAPEIIDDGSVRPQRVRKPLSPREPITIKDPKRPADDQTRKVN